MTGITHALSAALLHFVWQGLVVAFLLWVGLTILRNRPAQVRYLASCAALAIMTMVPVVTVWITYRTSVATNVPIGEFGDPHSVGLGTLSASASLTRWFVELDTWVLPIWLAGVVIFALRVIWSCRHVARLQREGHPAEAAIVNTVSRLARRMNVSRPVRVLISTLTDSPSVAGWLRPVLLLPAATLLNLSVEQLDAVLAHELAHVRRHDYLVNLLQTLAETLFFYHPAVWWASSHIRHERELCCDDLAVEICGDAVVYARALTKLERLRVIAPELAMSSTAGSLLYRIQRLTGAVEDQAPSKFPVLLAMSVALICFGMNLNFAQVQPQTANEDEIRREALRVDGVKFGDMPIVVRALGTLIGSTTAELNIAATQANVVKTGQTASLELQRGTIIAGKVTRINSYATDGNVTVAVELQADAPGFASQPVDGIVLVRTLNDVVYVGRPATSQADSESTLFKVEADGSYATRVKVRFGASSITSIQVLEGLHPGDRVILSDMTKYYGYERIRLQ